jgi:hypothetical protein
MKPDKGKPTSLGFTGTALLVVAAAAVVWFAAKKVAGSSGSLIPVGCGGALFLALALMALLAVAI